MLFLLICSPLIVVQAKATVPVRLTDHFPGLVDLVGEPHGRSVGSG